MYHREVLLVFPTGSQSAAEMTGAQSAAHSCACQTCGQQPSADVSTSSIIASSVDLRRFLAQQQVGPLQLHNSRPCTGISPAAAGHAASFASSSALGAEPAAAPPSLPSSSSSRSSAREQLERQYALQPPWLGFEVDVAGFSKKGYMRGGGKEQNQDRCACIYTKCSASKLRLQQGQQQ
jgi:hypothetical protein